VRSGDGDEETAVGNQQAGRLPTCIVHAVHDCIPSRERLEKLASALRVRDKFTLEALAKQVQRMRPT